jgi:hypothetical protein
VAQAGKHVDRRFASGYGLTDLVVAEGRAATFATTVIPRTPLSEFGSPQDYGLAK